MSDWKELNLINKVIIGAAIIVAACFAPELMILVDVGGIDLALGCLLFYFKPAIEWFKCVTRKTNEQLKIARDIILNSALAHPKIFTVNSLYCTFFMLVTGSFFLSLSLFLPALFVSGIYV